MLISRLMPCKTPWLTILTKRLDNSPMSHPYKRIKLRGLSCGSLSTAWIDLIWIEGSLNSNIMRLPKMKSLASKGRDREAMRGIRLWKRLKIYWRSLGKDWDMMGRHSMILGRRDNISENKAIAFILDMIELTVWMIERKYQEEVFYQ